MSAGGEGMAIDFDPFAAPALARTAASTEAQREIWTAAQMGAEASAAFNESVSLIFEGELDLPAYTAALQDLVARHEALRTTLSPDGLTLCIAAHLEVALASEDLSTLDAPAREARLRAACAREVQEPFALEHGPLFRTRLFKLGPRAHQAIFSAHHIVCDGWSMAVMLRDLGALYSARRQGTTADLPPAVAFSAYADGERAFESTPAYAASERHWLERLGGALPVLELPSDGARPPARSYSSLREDFALEPELVAGVKKVGARHGASFFTTMLAAFYALLARLSGEDETIDLIVGIPAAGQSVTGQPDLVGHCVNTLPLRLSVGADEPLPAFLRRVRTAMLDAYEHQRVTFGALLKKLTITRDPSRLPLVSVLFNVDQAVDGEALTFAGLDVRYRSNPRSFENFELFINAAETQGRVVLECQFNTDLFAPETIRRWLGAYRELLAGLVADDTRTLEALPLVPAAERTRLLHAWNAATFTEYPRELPVHVLFEAQARRTPEATAIVCGEQRLTFAELDARANRLARRLRAIGVRRDVLVGLHLPRSIDMLVAVSAILKAGGAYVPLDPAFPRDRLAFMIEDSRMPVLVTDADLARELPPHTARVLLLGDDSLEIAEPLAASDDDAVPESAAYVIYTSGSTGKPKGVVVPHRAVVNFLCAMAREPGLGTRDVLLAVTTLSFDIAVLELHLPLAVGARIVLATRELATDGALLLRTLEREQVTAMQATPATWRLLLAAGWKGTPNLTALVGGEALPRDLAAELVRRCAHVWNMYGPSETTVWSTCWRVSDPPGRILIGKPIANTTLYVLDRRREPVPVGVPGELYIGGDGVTRGYLHRPELDAERFGRDPFADDPAARLYRTGDLVRWLPDGNIEYLRRNDNQVKLRGYRIELGEIEAALTAAPGVKQAVVKLWEPRPGDVRLVGYLVPADAAPADADLRAHIKRTLPEYMVPQHFVTLSALPLTPNGKIDRRALPAPALDAAAEGRPRVAPRTPTEATIAGVFEEVLGLRTISVTDDFFELGGHSLLAAQVFSRLQRDHGIVLGLRRMFEAPTVAALARLVDGDAPAQAAHIPHRDEATPAPLSLMQQRLWVLEQFDPGLAVQHLPSAFRIRGALDAAAFQRAVDEIVRRHDTTRTRLRWEGDQAVQDVTPELHLDLTPVDLSARPGPDRETELLARLKADAVRPFDLGEGPLVRATLYRLEPDHHVFFWVPHHAIWDGWSFDIFLHELDGLYAAFSRGQPSPLPPLPIRYRDFAVWHRAFVRGPELARQAAHWKQLLAGELPVLELPTDRPRPARLSYRGATEAFVIPKAEIDALTALGRRAGATLYMVLLAAFKTLLHRHSGQEDIIIGTPIRGRSQPETENLLGFFVNTLVLRTDLSREPTFLDLLARVRAGVLDAFAHQDMPFEQLVQELGVRRDTSRTPIFQAFFTFQDVSNRAPRFGDLAYSQIHVHAPVAPTDLYLWVKETGNGLTGGIDYATDLFDAETIARFTRQFRHLLADVCRDPAQPIGRVAILPEAERQAIAAVNLTAAPYPRELGVHQLVERRALAHPERAAIVFGDETVSYGALATRARQLAAQLVARGVKPGDLVGIFLERSPAMLVAMLGVLEAGAGYVPLDPAFPRERLAFMVEDAQLRLLLSERALADELPAPATVLFLDDPPDAPAGALPVASGDDTAYVIYTSGSTGKPKGVVVPHRAVVNFLCSMATTPGLDEHDVLLAVTTLSFDIAVLELLLPLTVGAKIVLAARDEASDGDRLLALVRGSGATALQATPATWRLLIGAGWGEGEQLRKALVGGEAVPRDLALELARRCPAVWNMYGPTETTVWSTCAPLRPPLERVVIGRPIANTSVHVLDRRGERCPLGVPGELHLGGDGVARGYLRRPELTAERFVVDSGECLYRTGDLVRLRADGQLEYLRRNDNQVKLRGHRIELGEVETTLQRHPAVAQAVALVREDRPGDQRLVAYLVKAPDGDATDSELRRHLRQSLPDYMIPQHFLTLAALPLTPNGKIDRRALPPPFAVPLDDETFVPPETDSERLLADIWKAALGVQRVGVHDNFFAIGGHSLLSLTVIAQVEQATGARLSPRVLLLNSLRQAAAQLPATTIDVPPGAAVRVAATTRPTIVESLVRRARNKILGT